MVQCSCGPAETCGANPGLAAFSTDDHADCTAQVYSAVPHRSSDMAWSSCTRMAPRHCRTPCCARNLALASLWLWGQAAVANGLPSSAKGGPGPRVHQSLQHADPISALPQKQFHGTDTQVPDTSWWWGSCPSEEGLVILTPRTRKSTASPKQWSITIFLKALA